MPLCSTHKHAFRVCILQLCLHMSMFARNRREDAACAYFEGCQLAPGNKEFEAAFKGAIEAGRRDFLARNPKR